LNRSSATTGKGTRRIRAAKSCCAIWRFLLIRKYGRPCRNRREARASYGSIPTRASHIAGRRITSCLTRPRLIRNATSSAALLKRGSGWCNPKQPARRMVHRITDHRRASADHLPPWFSIDRASPLRKNEREGHLPADTNAGIAHVECSAAFGCDLPRPELRRVILGRIRGSRRRLPPRGQRAGSTPRRLRGSPSPCGTAASLGASRTHRAG